MSDYTTPAREQEQPQVEYRDLAHLGFPHYRVGDDASVWSRKNNKWKPRLTWRLLNQYRDSKGYARLQLSGEAGIVTVCVHHLVLKAFVGPKPEGMECRHLDGNPANNRLSNLCWGTPRENQADKARHGTMLTGTRAHGARLSEDDVREIRRRKAAGEHRSVIAAHFKIHVTYVNAIARGAIWAWLSAEPPAGRNYSERALKRLGRQPTEGQS